MKAILLALLAVVAIPATAASSVVSRPGARITITDEAYMGVKAKQISVAASVQGKADGSDESVAKWEVKSGAWLRDVLADWAPRVGWSLSWGLPADDDVRVGGSHVFKGDFTTAVTELMASLPDSVRIYVQLVPDNDPPMIYVTAEEARK